MANTDHQRQQSQHSNASFCFTAATLGTILRAERKKGSISTIINWMIVIISAESDDKTDVHLFVWRPDFIQMKTQNEKVCN